MFSKKIFVSKAENFILKERMFYIAKLILLITFKRITSAD